MAVNREKLSSFFDQACAVSLYLVFFSIPISTAVIVSFAGIAFLFFLGRLFSSRGLFIELIKKEKIVLFFFAALALSLINSKYFIEISLHALFLNWGEYIVLYLIITQTLTTAPRIKNALVSISLGAVLAILDCFVQLFFKLEFLRHRKMIVHTDNILAVSGPFKHNNDLAAYLICVLIIILYWVFSKAPQIVKSVAVIVFFLGIFILFHAYSRGGWISFILAITLLAILLKKFTFLGVSLLMAIILCFKFIFLKTLLVLDAGRIELWNISLKMIKAHPILGNGVGTFMAWFSSFAPGGSTICYAHNCYLQLWAEAGIISLVIFVFFVFKGLKSGLLGYKENKDPVFLILICAIVAFLAHSFVDTFFFSYQLFTLFWVMMGLLNASVTAQARQK